MMGGGGGRGMGGGGRGTGGGGRGMGGGGRGMGGGGRGMRAAPNVSVEPKLQKGDDSMVAVVDPSKCAGCGVCVSACPNEALSLSGRAPGARRPLK
ncbi:MAG TPA: 4Fe-4S binding protein [Polyangia bacterium]|nr:4Fe-4S binding protein [Polyangia bacterium]